MTIGGGIFGTESAEEHAGRQVAERRRADIVKLGHHGFDRLEGLHEVGRMFFADKAGRLWRAATGEPQGGYQPPDFAFSVLSDGTVGWWARPAEHEPQTRAELEAWNAAAVERSQREAAAVLAEARSRSAPVTLHDVDPVAPVSLREALERIEPAGGGARIVKGQLVVDLPPGTVDGPGGPTLRGAVKALYLGEAAILAAVPKDGPVPAGRLPDRPLLPSGRLAP